MNKILLANTDKPGQKSIQTYRERNGYKVLEKALGMQPATLVEEVKTSGLRGRGGGGGPARLERGGVPPHNRQATDPVGYLGGSGARALKDPLPRLGRP